jgi:carbon monoxide dehydrogenase subunit G
MPLTCEIEATVAAPAERVWASLLDIGRMGEWMKGFVRVERLTEGPLAKGSQFRQTRKMFGREASEVFEVFEFDPPRVLGLYVDGKKGSSGRGWYRFRYTLAPDGAGTRLVLSGEFGGQSGCMALLGKIMLGAMKKAFRKELLTFKAWVERSAPQA